MSVTLDIEVAMTTKRILIVDDEVHVREVVQTCLETLGGWDVLSVASGREGLLKAEAEQPDAILLDVMMPGMDGLAFLRQLRSNPATQDIPVVLLTAMAHRFNQQQLLELGVRGAIAKPFNPVLLTDQIASALDW
jgi:CheY-like chemotaxis protein